MSYFKGLIRYKSLLYQLIKRDIKVKYKRSVLGTLWTVLNPLLTMLVLMLVFSQLFRFDIENYPVYLISGQILFNFFNESTNMALLSILNNSDMIKKVNVPRFVFPTARVISSLVFLGFSLIALFIVMIITQITFHWTILLLIVPIFWLFIFAMGIGLILSVLLPFFRDIQHLYGVFLMMVMYATPIFYPVGILPDKFLTIAKLNPLYHFVTAFREVVMYGRVIGLKENLILAGLAIGAMLLGLWVFKRKQSKVILYI